MTKLNGLTAAKILLDGGIIQHHERYYQYDRLKNEIQYCDEYTNWQYSNIGIEQIIKLTDWTLVKSEKMKKMEALLDGEVIKIGDSFFKFDFELNHLIYSENNKDWNYSDYTFNDLLSRNHLND